MAGWLDWANKEALGDGSFDVWLDWASKSARSDRSFVGWLVGLGQQRGAW